MFDRRITITLPELVAAQLIAIADQNRRHPRDEALFRLERSLSRAARPRGGAPRREPTPTDFHPEPATA
jgi:hypothetical protein